MTKKSKDRSGISHIMKFKSTNFFLIYLKNWTVCLKSARKVKQALHRFNFECVHHVVCSAQVFSWTLKVQNWAHFTCGVVVSLNKYGSCLWFCTKTDTIPSTLQKSGITIYSVTSCQANWSILQHQHYLDPVPITSC
jgi:hypothetical protein